MTRGDLSLALLVSSLGCTLVSQLPGGGVLGLGGALFLILGLLVQPRGHV